jgi:AcrR family transcriptional regulator
MPTRGKAGRYHHGDLKAALVDTAVELITEQGVRGFSMAAASRRLGVAVSAPYAHFASRDDLLAAVAVHAYEVFLAEARAGMTAARTPTDRLAAMARAYVRFAGIHRPLFEVLFDAGLDKSRHPEIKAAEQPINDAFLGCVNALTDSEADAADLSAAVEAVAHGHAMLLLDGSYGPRTEAIDPAAERAARATRALVEGRRPLHQ